MIGSHSRHLRHSFQGKGGQSERPAVFHKIYVIETIKTVGTIFTKIGGDCKYYHSPPWCPALYISTCERSQSFVRGGSSSSRMATGVWKRHLTSFIQDDNWCVGERHPSDFLGATGFRHSV